MASTSSTRGNERLRNRDRMNFRATGKLPLQRKYSADRGNPRVSSSSDDNGQQVYFTPPSSPKIPTASLRGNIGEELAATKMQNSALLVQNNALRAENEAVRAENDALRRENDALRAENDAIRTQIRAMRSAQAQKNEKELVATMNELESRLAGEQEKMSNFEKEPMGIRKEIEANMPEQRPVTVHLRRGIMKNIMVIGGTTGEDIWNKTLDSVITLDLETHQLSSLRRLPAPRQQLGVSVQSDKIYAVGGYDGSQYCDSVFTYDPNEDKWINAQSLNKKRHCFNVVRLENLLVAVGGWDGQKALKNVEALDPRQEKWMDLPDMIGSRYAHAVVPLNGSIYAIGGLRGDGSIYLRTVETYDPRAKKWSTGPSLPSERGWIAGVTVLQRAFVIGGRNIKRHVCNTAWVLNDNSWEPVCGMTKPRSVCGAAAVDSSLFAVGGFSGSEGLDSIEYLDTATSRSSSEQSWSKLDVHLQQPIYDAGVVAVPKLF